MKVKLFGFQIQVLLATEALFSGVDCTANRNSYTKQTLQAVLTMEEHSLIYSLIV